MSPKRLSEIAPLIGARLEGEDVVVSGVNALELAEEDDLSFVESARHLKAAQKTRARALIVPPGLSEKLPAKGLLISENVRAALAKVAQLFFPPPSFPKGVSPLAYLEEGVEVHPEACVFPFCYLGRKAKIGPRAVLFPGVFVGEEAEIGEECWLYPQVTIYPRTKIGPRVIIHAGAVVGSDGFGYAQEGGRHLKIPHVGRVEIEEEVELGANTCVDRATFGVTRLGAGSKIDNLVQIAHNVELGRACILAGQVGLTGSVKVGDLVMVGGQAGINARVGDQAMIAARAGVAKEVPPKAVVAGAPAMDIRHWRRCVAAYERLPELLKEIRELRKRIEILEEALNGRDPD